MVRRGSNILDDLPPTPELLRHFKSRVATFEEERNVLLGKIDECKLQHKEKHKLEFELRRREEEVRDLQKALSEAHTCLFEERERFLEVQRHPHRRGRSEITQKVQEAKSDQLKTQMAWGRLCCSQ